MSSTSVPTPAPRGLDALIDALHYPLRAPAWILNLIYVAGRVVASSLPVFGPVLHALLTLGVYKYAFECLASSARGRATPPEALSSVDSGTHRRHLLLQLWWLILLVVLTHFVDTRTAVLLVAAVALALPGALIALCVAQNLLAALNPFSWWAVATRLGLSYLVLSAATFAVLMLQVAARDLLEDAPWRLVAIAAFYALSQHVILALFRALGNALHAHAGPLEFDIADEHLPTIQRDRELAAQAQERRDALAATDPSARADALAAQLHNANDHALHREYRQVLRSLDRRDALMAHARTHLCELLALGQTRLALALAHEALEDDPHFTLPEAAPLATLIDAGERAGLMRQVAAIAANYGAAFPKRYDALAPTLRAATLYADRLADPDTARALLQRGAALAGDGSEAAEFSRLQHRLDAGLPLHDAAFVESGPRPR